MNISYILNIVLVLILIGGGYYQHAYLHTNKVAEKYVCSDCSCPTVNITKLLSQSENIGVFWQTGETESQKLAEIFYQKSNSSRIYMTPQKGVFLYLLRSYDRHIYLCNLSIRFSTDIVYRYASNLQKSVIIAYHEQSEKIPSWEMDEIKVHICPFEQVPIVEYWESEGGYSKAVARAVELLK
uniref:Uncharacterized protein n=1 Tax=Mimivirus LCMiAC01 TaxID=2506608 RepID=A0A481YZM1_9VIRU|nr:MAG: hypothetical protein LCMiAC01_03710 [Mimivirus LCMiAC01]